MKISAVILAGGTSSRMGCDKGLLNVGGQILLERQIDTLVAAGLEDIFISGRPEADYSKFGCQILNDHFPDAGPLAGIHAALLNTRHPLLLVLAVDLPAMRAPFLQSLIMTATAGGVIPRVDGQIEPLAAVYPRTTLGLIEEQLQAGNFAVREFAQACVRARLASFFDVTPEFLTLFKNLNRPEDLSCPN